MADQRPRQPVLPRALLLLRDAMHVLMESTRRGLSLRAVRDRIPAAPGVVGSTTFTPGRSRSTPR